MVSSPALNRYPTSINQFPPPPPQQAPAGEIVNSEVPKKKGGPKDFWSSFLNFNGFVKNLLEAELLILEVSQKKYKGGGPPPPNLILD